jgi:hypothetical protein
MMLPFGLSLSDQGGRLSSFRQLLFQLTNSSALFPVQSFWQFQFESRLQIGQHFLVALGLGLCSLRSLFSFGFLLLNGWSGTLTLQGSPYCHIMNVQTRDGLQ